MGHPSVSFSVVLLALRIGINIHPNMNAFVSFYMHFLPYIQTNHSPKEESLRYSYIGLNSI